MASATPVIQTNSQKMAHAAYLCIARRCAGKEFPSYKSFAQQFPALVHTCGLAQAAAFARAKKEHHADYLEDLAEVLKAAGSDRDAGVRSAADLERAIREAELLAYVRLSRMALQAAGWLKRYAEAAGEPEKGGD